MKLTKQILGVFGMLIFLSTSGFSQAPCPNNNPFNGFPNPFNASAVGAGGAVTSTNSWGGDYLNTDVQAGAEYTWTACGTGVFNAEFTLYRDVVGTLLASSSDFCGNQPEITWTATFTGRVRLVIDENPCNNNSFHLPVTLTQNTPAGGLPIEILYFDGQYEEGTVNLSWAFSEALEYQELYLEKSADGASFTRMANLEGISMAEKNHSATDPSPFPKRSYYRLASVDVNGALDYSKTIEVITPATQRLDIWPNPSEGVFYLFFASDQNLVSAEVMDHMGRKVWGENLSSNSAGYVERKLALSHLSEGIYFLRLRDNNGWVSRRIVIR